ncbi:MAG: hypothetical protein NTX50_00950 [Candidatus Sumerlaeota bacterium]|nr:hypothetical protein [Candidatus Sumerlaeota bacterium]
MEGIKNAILAAAVFAAVTSLFGGPILRKAIFKLQQCSVDKMDALFISFIGFFVTYCICFFALAYVSSREFGIDALCVAFSVFAGFLLQSAANKLYLGYLRIAKISWKTALFASLCQNGALIGLLAVLLISVVLLLGSMFRF